MLHQKLFLIPALVAGLALAGCAEETETGAESTEEVGTERMGYDQQDQQVISPGLDTDANGIEDTEEGVSDQDPDSTETGSL